MSDELSYTIDIRGIKELIEKLKSSVKADTLKRGVWQGALFLGRWSKVNRLTGGGNSKTILNVRSGNLRASIAANAIRIDNASADSPATTQSGNNFLVNIGTNVIYGRIHEFGGRITPISAPYLRFKTLDGHWHSVKEVNIPARPFLRPAIENSDNQKYVLEVLTRNINEAIEKQ